MITHRLFSYTLAASAAAAGAQVTLPEGNVRLLDTAVVATPTSPLDHMACPDQASAAITSPAGRPLRLISRSCLSFDGLIPATTPSKVFLVPQSTQRSFK